MSEERLPPVGENLSAVRARVAAACRGADRDTDSVTIVGVTKTHPPEVARAAVEAGVTHLGENRVAELLAKRPRVEGARWHFVGRLQSRKARDVVGVASLIHSVDRRSLVDELAKRASVEEPQGILIQVNVGDDPRKGGCRIDETTDLVAYAHEQPSLAVKGLMTMPPMPPEDGDPNEASRPFFAALRELRSEVRTRVPAVRHLSMGMTADLEAAVAEGATLVRVGRALFGERRARPWQPIGGLR